MTKLKGTEAEPRLMKHKPKTKRSNRPKKGLSKVSLTPKRTSLIFLCFLFLLFNPVLTQAEPTDLAQKKQEAERVKQQLRNIDSELDVAVEKYNQANDNLAKTQSDIKQTKENQKQASKKLSKQKKVFNQRLVKIYKNGNVNFISPLFGTESFADFITRVSYLLQISNQDFELVQSIQKTKTQLEEAQKKLEKAEGEQILLTTDLLRNRRAIEGQLSNRRVYLASVQTDVQAIIGQEEEQEAQNQAKQVQTVQRRQTQPAPQNNQNNRQNNNNQNNQPPQNNPNQNPPTQNPPNNNPSNGGNEANKPPDPPKQSPSPPKTAPHSEVVGIAMRELGKPYQWGAAGPNAFDCSGLVMYCYRQVGVSLPHSAAAQYNRGERISRENMAAGDLVFFGKTGVSHVGIYAGGGRYIHAPHTGDVVKVSSLSSRSDFYGACRP